MPSGRALVPRTEMPRLFNGLSLILGLGGPLRDEDRLPRAALLRALSKRWLYADHEKPVRVNQRILSLRLS